MGLMLYSPTRSRLTRQDTEVRAGVKPAGGVKWMSRGGGGFKIRGDLCFMNQIQVFKFNYIYFLLHPMPILRTQAACTF